MQEKVEIKRFCIFYIVKHLGYFEFVLLIRINHYLNGYIYIQPIFRYPYLLYCGYWIQLMEPSIYIFCCMLTNSLYILLQKKCVFRSSFLFLAPYHYCKIVVFRSVYIRMYLFFPSL